MEIEKYSKALADRTRLRILNLLLHGELCVCDIQHVLGAPQPNVSRHLAYLKHSGLVLDRRDGYRIFYRLAEPQRGIRRPMYEFLRAAFGVDDIFRQDIAKLKRAVEKGACTVTEWRAFAGLRAQASARE
jgi:ArsR family transcriptional regulator